MFNFAVMDNDKVLNTIVAESKDIAEQVTGRTCIEYAPQDKAEPGGTFDGVSFIQRKPFPSWLLNEDKHWVAPIAKPDSGEDWEWDEGALQWKEIILPLE